MRMIRIATFLTAAAFAAAAFAGCKSARQHRLEADKAADSIIEEKQKATFGQTEPFTVERPADTLRRRLMLQQNLQYSHPGSLSTKDLKPTRHWPRDDYLSTQNDVPDPSAPGWTGGTLRLGLLDALQVAAHNSSVYQARKETVFTTALRLDLERDDFRTSWEGIINNEASFDLAPNDDVIGVTSSPELSASKRFRNGLSATARLGLDLVQLLQPNRASTLGLVGDFTVSLPLLAGSGKWIITEPLTQAEREVVYQLLEFDQFKREFAVNIASSYLGVLQAADQVENAEQSYRRVVLSARRSRRYADAGRLPEFQVDQALQQELEARERWIDNRAGYARQLDQFKTLLGLPPDASVELDRAELTNLARRTEESLQLRGGATTQPNGGPTTRPTQAATAPVPGPATTQATTQDIVLREPEAAGGPYEIEEEAAIAIALQNRPDLKVSQGEVYDSQREVAIAGDALGPILDLIARGNFSDGRGLGSVDERSGTLRPEDGNYSLSAPLELPLERTSQRNAYRTSLIQLESATRNLQEAEDDIKLTIRNQLRNLLSSREGLQTQAEAVVIALRRVKSTDILLDAGRAEVRDVLEAQTSLVDAQDAFTESLVDYRIAELQLQRDLGLLAVNHEGQWQEYSPEALRRMAAAGPATRPTAPAALPGVRE